MVWVICTVLYMAAVCFAASYFLLKGALRKASRELREIREDLEQNRVLRLPFPDRDLSEALGEMNRTLEEIRRQGREYARREKQFREQIENISHDLRTPLTVILGYLKLFQAGSSQTDMPDLRIVEKNARILERLVGQFYEFSQVSAEGFTPKLERVDANRSCREALAAHCQALGEMVPELSLPDHPVIVRGEEQLLERIFLNLIRNAGQYGRSYLKVGMEETEGEVRILFENDTERISAEEVPRLFERFYRGDKARGSEGAGLGLAIARSLAQSLGGTLEGEAVRGDAGGTVVRFVLVLRKNQEDSNHLISFRNSML